MRTKLLAFIVFAALPCFGQTFGEITGVVTDPSGALVVGAAVTVSNPATNLTRTATTNNAGNYTFPSLLPVVQHCQQGGTHSYDAALVEEWSHGRSS